MAASPEQAAQIALDGALGCLSSADQCVRAVTTRIANRARSQDEADDLRLLIEARCELARCKTLVQQASQYAR